MPTGSPSRHDPSVHAPSRRGAGARRRGFTLIELVIALAVLGLLTGIAVPIYGKYQERARVARAVADIRIIEAAVDRYIAEFQRVPTAIDRIIDPPPVDPWGRPYQYLKLKDAPAAERANARKDKNLVPINTDYDLYSMGMDGVTNAPLTAPPAEDDIIRANDGGFVGLAADY